ncbi:MAG: sulfite exporter TauE/SafE family protein [Gomphosphaeria aponina SAG 52.96 = DSM 107014]|uniref:Probable membrane transporter protein n=1 Tax=Gomphosphaeria aponina SAG 52.96 = DSM 107014 TaxID=1521640 RepID=A0A941JS58_9CHRO|nr:sulfite exporter TauE/SafE family protein [Gomphosphaeria aponina SAG 52.96 = DSM 107014]
MITTIIGHILAVAIGMTLGLIGGGGSVLAVPTLIYVMGISSKEAITMTLIIVGIVSLIGIIPHWRQGNVNLKIATVFIPPAMLGTYLGATLALLPFISDTFQLICFGIIMLLASILMIGKGSSKEEKNKIIEPKKNKYQWLVIPAEGLGVGIVTGFVGVGGGFAIIPALVLIGGIPMKEAIGTSLLIIAFNSVTGVIKYLSQVSIDWNLTISFTLAATIGTVSGAYLSRVIQAKELQKVFGYFVLAVAVFVLIRR